MDEREQIEKASLNKVMLQRTSEISSQNPRRKGGGVKKKLKRTNGKSRWTSFGVERAEEYI